MKTLKNLLPYVIASLLIIVFWRIITLTDNYAFNPKGKELLMLEIALTYIFLYKTIFWLLVGNLSVYTIKLFIKNNFKAARISGIMTIMIYLIIGQIVQKKCASDYYTVFMNQSTNEDLLEIPIKEAGYHIGPILTKNISDKGMRLRRYAIAGLGEIKYKPAIPELKKILYDRTELDYFRADALETLMLFHSKRSKKIIDEFKSQADNPLDKKVIDLYNLWTKPKK
jgi:hypothetical protein